MDSAKAAPTHPLGPLVRTFASMRPVRVRLTAGATLLAVLAVEIVAAWLQPDGSGIGTHCQLGFPPCAMVLMVGIPCPTCGMTTAFAHTIRGQWLSAFLAQPFGFLLAIGALALAGAAAYTLITGRRVEINWYRLPPPRVAMITASLFAAAWGYKVLIHVF